MPEETADELGILIAAHHGLVVVETVEEERLGEILWKVCERHGMRLFDWTVSDGLRRQPEGEGLGSNTLHPAQAVGHIECMTLDAIYWLKDFGKCLEDEMTVRRMREAAATFASKKSCMVISGHDIVLPQVLEPVAARFRLKLPAAVEMVEVIDATVASLREREVFETVLSDEEKAFAGGGGDGSDGGTSRRLLGAFLTWLQEKKATVFVVGTANDIDSVPPELLRKGRFVPVV